VCCVAQPPRSTARNEFIMANKVSDIQERPATQKGAPGNYHNQQGATLPTPSATSAPQQETSFSVPYEPPTEPEGGAPGPRRSVPPPKAKNLKLGKGPGDGCFLSKANITQGEFWYAVTSGVIDLNEIQWPDSDDPAKRDVSLAKVPTRYIPTLRDMYGTKPREWISTRHKRKEPVQLPLNLFGEERVIRLKDTTTTVIDFAENGQAVFPGANFAEAKFATLPGDGTVNQEMTLDEKVADLEVAITKKFQMEVANGHEILALQARMRVLETQAFTPS
jgi:hypothetical protein